MVEGAGFSAPLDGLKVVTSELLTERVQHSRSPARARRRARRGFPQHYVTRPSRTVYHLGDQLVMHPALLAEVRQSLRPPGASASGPVRDALGR